MSTIGRSGWLALCCGCLLTGCTVGTDEEEGAGGNGSAEPLPPATETDFLAQMGDTAWAYPVDEGMAFEVTTTTQYRSLATDRVINTTIDEDEVRRSFRLIDSDGDSYYRETEQAYLNYPLPEVGEASYHRDLAVGEDGTIYARQRPLDAWHGWLPGQPFLGQRWSMTIELADPDGDGDLSWEFEAQISGIDVVAPNEENDTVLIQLVGNAVDSEGEVLDDIAPLLWDLYLKPGEGLIYSISLLEYVTTFEGEEVVRSVETIEDRVPAPLSASG